MAFAISTLVICTALSFGAACKQNPMSTEEIVATLRSEITVGMDRADVERRLANLPVTYTYVPRARLEVTSEASFEGKPLSGRFDVLTPHEPQFLYMKQAYIFIELDEQQRVVNVRVE